MTEAENKLEFMDIAQAAMEIHATLRAAAATDKYKQFVIGKDNPYDHKYFSTPVISKKVWTAVGDQVAKNEKSTLTNVRGDQWMSFRLDGHGFSKLVKKLNKTGVYGATHYGYSHDFAEIMRECCQEVVKLHTGFLGYTQSDEMTILVAPRPVKTVRVAVEKEDGSKEIVSREVQIEHENNGRVLKLCTLTASFVTAHFNDRLRRLFAKNGVPFPEPHEMLATFDCRMGAYNSFEEAMTLPLWRSYDSGINGVSDAVHHLKFAPMEFVKEKGIDVPDGASWKREVEKMVGKNAGEKQTWLHAKGLFPLPTHQAYGSMFHVRKAVRRGINPKTGEAAPPKLARDMYEVQLLRESDEDKDAAAGRPGGIAGLLNLYAADEVFLPDEELEAKVQGAEPAKAA